MTTYTTPLTTLITTNSSPLVNVNATNTANVDAGFKLLVQIVCVLIIISGVVGNVIVLIVFISRWATLKTYEVFIVTLAVADLLGTIILPCIQVHEVSGGSFQGIGTVGCKIVNFLASLSIYVSSLTLTMVSIDRYIAVKWPFKKRENICRGMITITWVFGFCGALVYLLGDRVMLHKIEKQWVCRLFGNDSEVTMIALVTFSIQNAIPILFMTVLYGLIIHELNKNSNCNEYHIDASAMQVRRRSIRKTTKLLISVVLVFFMCVTPSNIFFMLYCFDLHGLPHEYIYPVHVLLSMLMMANSCVNPLIYGKLHSSFRNETICLFLSCLHFLQKGYSSSRSEMSNKQFIKYKHRRHTNVASSSRSFDHYGPPIAQDDSINYTMISKDSSFHTENRRTSSILNMASMELLWLNDNTYKIMQMLKENMESESSPPTKAVCTDIYENLYCIHSSERETML